MAHLLEQRPEPQRQANTFVTIARSEPPIPSASGADDSDFRGLGSRLVSRAESAKFADKLGAGIGVSVACLFLLTLLICCCYHPTENDESSSSHSSSIPHRPRHSSRRKARAVPEHEHRREPPVEVQTPVHVHPREPPAEVQEPVHPHPREPPERLQVPEHVQPQESSAELQVPEIGDREERSPEKEGSGKEGAGEKIIGEKSQDTKDLKKKGPEKRVLKGKGLKKSSLKETSPEQGPEKFLKDASGKGPEMGSGIGREMSLGKGPEEGILLEENLEKEVMEREGIEKEDTEEEGLMKVSSSVQTAGEGPSKKELSDPQPLKEHETTKVQPPINQQKEDHDHQEQSQENFLGENITAEPLPNEPVAHQESAERGLPRGPVVQVPEDGNSTGSSSVDLQSPTGTDVLMSSSEWRGNRSRARGTIARGGGRRPGLLEAFLSIRPPRGQNRQQLSGGHEQRQQQMHVRSRNDQMPSQGQQGRNQQMPDLAQSQAYPQPQIPDNRAGAHEPIPYGQYAADWPQDSQFTRRAQSQHQQRHGQPAYQPSNRAMTFGGASLSQPHQQHDQPAYQIGNGQRAYPGVAYQPRNANHIPAAPPRRAYTEIPQPRRYHQQDNPVDQPYNVRNAYPIIPQAQSSANRPQYPQDSEPVSGWPRNPPQGPPRNYDRPSFL